MDKLLYAAIAVLFIFFIASSLLVTKKSKKSGSFNPIGMYRRKSLFTTNEKQQYLILRDIANRLNLFLLAKVRLIDVVEPRNSKDISLVNRIIRKHCDFVLLDTSGLTVAVIELDDSSHNSASAKTRDDIKDKVLADAGVPLLRTRYITEDIYNRLMEIVSPIEKV